MENKSRNKFDTWCKIGMGVGDEIRSKEGRGVNSSVQPQQTNTHNRIGIHPLVNLACILSARNPSGTTNGYSPNYLCGLTWARNESRPMILRIAHVSASYTWRRDGPESNPYSSTNWEYHHIHETSFSLDERWTHTGFPSDGVQPLRFRNVSTFWINRWTLEYGIDILWLRPGPAERMNGRFQRP